MHASRQWAVTLIFSPISIFKEVNDSSCPSIYSVFSQLFKMESAGQLEGGMPGVVQQVGHLKWGFDPLFITFVRLFISQVKELVAIAPGKGTIA